MISPRVAVSSGSRRRRRRKNSQSDSKKQSSLGFISPIPHCVSPVDTTSRNGSISEQTTVGNDSPERLFSPVRNGKRPPSTGNGVRPNSAGKQEKARARLLDRFETAGSQETLSGYASPSSIEMAQSLSLAKEPTESPEKPACAVSTVQPVLTGRPAKGGWANLPKTCVHVNSYLSILDYATCMF